MAVEIKTTGEVLTAYLGGEIDHHSAAGVRSEIDMAIELNMPSMVILDFSGVSFMDSSGIGLIMGRYKIVSKSGGKLHVSGVTPQNYKVMKLAGLERLSVLDETSVLKG